MDCNLIKKGSIYAIIPARGGSKGVPGKNIRCLKGYPLIAYSIAICKMSSKIDRTIISTDSGQIAETARKYGGEIPFYRPIEYAKDMSGDIEFVNHALNWFADNEGCLPEYIVHVRPTTPLRRRDIFDSAIETMISNKEATSMRSAHKAPESPFKWFLKTEEGYLKGLRENISNEKANEGRQKFPVVYIPDGYIDIIKTEYVIQNGILHGEKMLGFESPMCTEVDTEEELKQIEYQIENTPSDVFEYLIKNYKI